MQYLLYVRIDIELIFCFSKIVLQALNDLQKFCKQREENKQIIVDCNGVETLIQLISSPNQVMQRLALKILSLTSHIRKAKLIFRDHEVYISS